MSYDIDFRVKVEGVDAYVSVGECDANITWNVRKMILAATGLEWKNCENNGFVKDIMPSIFRGYNELSRHPSKYKKYEAENGCGTVDGCRNFFYSIIDAWNNFQSSCETRDLVDVVTFWIT